MKLLVILIVLLCYWFTVFIQPVMATYDPLSVANNRFGIHILEPGELDKAAQLVNSAGGDWGYVTIPIRANDRNLLVWEEFMKRCGQLHLIPILRIASFPSANQWMAPNEYDLIDFANFLDLLPWPTKNRYVIVYNEPNHNTEWGGFVYPAEYARVLSRAIDILHHKNPDYFVISAGMDSSSSDTTDSLNVYQYWQEMEEAIPGILSQADGMAFHSYGNPGFTSPPNYYSTVNIYSFRKEIAYLNYHFALAPKIFITEAGWKHGQLPESLLSSYYLYGLNNVWTNDVVALTPFVFNAQQGDFTDFSFLDSQQHWYAFAKTYQEYPKIAGKPIINDNIPLLITAPPISTENDDSNSLLPKVIKSLDTLIFNFRNIFK